MKPAHAGGLHVIAHSFLMNGNVVPVSAFVPHRTSSRRGRLRLWSAERALVLSAGGSRAQSDCRLKHHERIQERGLRFAVSPVPSLCVRPPCCACAAHRSSPKAHGAGQRSAASLGPMRHNLAVVRTGRSVAPLSDAVPARRTLPR